MTVIKPRIVAKGAMTMVGVEVRTNNRNEADPTVAQTPQIWKRHLQERLADRIGNRSEPKATVAVYRNYESDYTGEYSYLLGAEVKQPGSVPAAMVSLTIEPANYLVFESRGAIPEALIDTGGTILAELFTRGGARRRAYVADFEIHNVNTPAQVAIFIGVR